MLTCFGGHFEEKIAIKNAAFGLFEILPVGLTLPETTINHLLSNMKMPVVFSPD